MGPQNLARAALSIATLACSNSLARDTTSCASDEVRTPAATTVAMR